jgi:hypothetical protein
MATAIASYQFLDRTTDYIDYGDITWFDGYANFSISAWVKLNTDFSTADSVASKWSINSNTWVFILETRGADGSFEFVTSNSAGTGFALIPSSTTTSLNTWTFITGTLNGTSGTL